VAVVEVNTMDSLVKPQLAVLVVEVVVVYGTVLLDDREIK
jgi:hypothetical protein